MSIIITSVLAAVVAAVAYWLACFSFIEAGTMCAIMMVAICLLPLRAITAKVIPWGIEYYASRNSDFGAKVKERWVTESLDPDKEKFLNNGITMLGNAVIWVYWIMEALFFWAFKPLAVYCIEMMMYVVRSFSNLWGTPAEIMAFFAWFLLTIGVVAYLFFLYTAFRKNKKARENGQDEPYDFSFCCWVFIALFVARKIFTYVYYGMSVGDAFLNALLWLSIPTLLWIIEHVVRGINHILNRMQNTNP